MLINSLQSNKLYHIKIFQRSKYEAIVGQFQDRNMENIDKQTQ